MKFQSNLKSFKGLLNFLKDQEVENIDEWIGTCPGSYKWAKKQSYFQKILKSCGLKNTRWNKEKLKRFLKKKGYKTIKEWKNDNFKSYKWALGQDFYPELRKAFIDKKESNLLRLKAKRKKERQGRSLEKYSA